MGRTSFLGKTLTAIRSHPVDSAALVVSFAALILSVLTIADATHQHSDSLTSQMIRDAYSDFIQLNDLRAQYPLQSHIFETANNYAKNKSLVSLAVKSKLDSEEERAKLLLEEAAVAERIMTMFEHSFYQWKHARENTEASRASFLKAVLDYFTQRILVNPRLVWYWSKNGANLSEHFEADTIAFYNQEVKLGKDSSDPKGPFAPPLSKTQKAELQPTKSE